MAGILDHTLEGKANHDMSSQAEMGADLLNVIGQDVSYLASAAATTALGPSSQPPSSGRSLLYPPTAVSSSSLHSQQARSETEMPGQIGMETRLNTLDNSMSQSIPLHGKLYLRVLYSQAVIVYMYHICCQI